MRTSLTFKVQKFKVYPGKKSGLIVKINNEFSDELSSSNTIFSSYLCFQLRV